MKDRALISIGEKYGPAMEITGQEEADKYFEELVRHNLSFGETTRQEAERFERSNLGYFAGYYSNEVRERVERLFNCEHPVFGKISVKGPPTMAEAFVTGACEAIKRKREN